MFYDFFEIRGPHPVLLVRFLHIAQKDASPISIHELVSSGTDGQRFEVHKKVTNTASGAYVIDRWFDSFESFDRSGLFFVHH